jgi:hypothetical protein
MPELLAIVALTLLLIWVALRGRSADPMRFMVSVQQADKPAGWGWLVILLTVAAGALWVVVTQ